MKTNIVYALLTGAILVGCGSGSGNTELPVLNKAVFTNFGNNSLTQCDVNANGINNTSCQTITPTGSGALNYPTGVAIHGNYAYIVNSDSASSYTQCEITANGINSSSCQTITPSESGGMSYVTGIAFAGNYVYFASGFGTNGNSYTQCNLGSNGIDSSSCQTVKPNGSGALNGPTLIAINNNYIYFVNFNNNSYTQCGLTGSGINSASCQTNVVNNLNGPEGIAFNGSYAYFTNYNNDSYTQCNVNASGIESSTCQNFITTSFGALNYPIGLAINNNYAYFANNNMGTNSYTKCSIDSSGIISSSCQSISPSGTGELNAPFAIAFY